MSSHLLIVCLFLAGLAIHVSLCSSELPPADDNLNIYALPVGQGDCTVIQCPKTNTGNGKGDITIIDAGAKVHYFDKKVFTDYLKGATIKYVILTHPHRDHYDLIDSMLDGHTENLQVYHSCHWQRYKKITTLMLYPSSKIDSCLGTTSCNTKLKLCDSVTLTVIASELGGCGKHPNEDSIVSKITYKGVSTLISGDFEGSYKKIKKFLEKAGTEIKADIYRLAHHGAYSDKKNGLKPNHPDLLTAVGATYYFSSSGLDEGYRHPRCKLYDEITSNHTHLRVDNHSYSCYNEYGIESFTTDKPIYVTTLEDEYRHHKNYVISFAIKKDGTISPTTTLFNGAMRYKSEQYEEL